MKLACFVIGTGIIFNSKLIKCLVSIVTSKVKVRSLFSDTVFIN